MWNHKYLSRIDLKIVLILFLLMGISLMVISSMTLEEEGGDLMTPYVRSQIERFVIGWLLFLFFSGFDYRKLKDWSWILYFIMVFLLLGLFFTSPIQSVHRWYKIPFVGMNFQPSEYAKLIVVICLSWFLEKREEDASSLKTALMGCLIAGIPFLLILKQPDLGTALVLYPITLVIFYFGGIHRKIFSSILFLGILGTFLTVLLFGGIISSEKVKPFCTTFMKEYQFDRLNADNYHQNAAKISIAIGGIKGSGWHKSEFSSKKWLPAAHTDSVFAAYAEEFGLIGVLILLLLYYGLIYQSFQVVSEAKDYFGMLLASGIAVYLAMHIIVNIAMMCGFLPLSGVPLLLITYGGSSVVTTMAALGILQSIYTRRFMF
jgi:rod shape determining protein RodA